MESEHLQNSDVSWGHEPVGIPLNRPPGTFSPDGGEGRDEAVRFMERVAGRGRFAENPPPFSAVKHFFTFDLAPANLKLL